MQEIYDLAWSPDSTYIVVGALDGKSEIIRIRTRDSVTLPAHSSYVQGVAWDPMNQMVVTQSADRSCKTHVIRYKSNYMVRLAPKGHCSLRMLNLSKEKSEKPEKKEEKKEEKDRGDAGDDPSDKNKNSVNLYADCSNVPSFFRLWTFKHQQSS